MVLYFEKHWFADSLEIPTQSNDMHEKDVKIIFECVYFICNTILK